MKPYAVAIVVIVGCVACADAMPFLNWGTTSGNGDPFLGDSSGTALVGHKTDETIGCFVQLIWDVDMDGLDAIDIGQSDGAGDDDTVLGWSHIGFNTGFGITDGHFWQTATDTSALGTNDRLYIRTWDVPAESDVDFAAGNAPFDTASYYWDSGDFFTVPDTEVGLDWHVGSVPEPSTLGLLAAGLLTVAVRRGIGR